MVKRTTLVGVPVIDVSSLGESSNDTDQKEATIKAIGEACRDWGFFYAVGHAVEPELISRFKDQSSIFLNKPKEFKRTIRRREDNAVGYYDQEFTKQKLDWKEGFDFAANGSLGVPSKLLGSNQWPEGMPEFKETMCEYFQAMHDLGRQLMRAIWISLKSDLTVAEGAFDNVHTSLLRLNYYAKCTNSEETFGVGEHTDPGALTVLLQDDNISSLQVKQNEEWYDVPPVPGSYVINIGDLVQVWSNGLYKAALHRVLTSKTFDRFSAAFFYNPTFETDVAPLDGCISEETPLRYKPINWGDFVTQRIDGNYANLGEDIQIWHYEIKKSAE